MALYLADKIVGETETKAIQLRIEYDPNPKYDSGNYLHVSKEVIELAEKRMEKDAKKDIGLMDLIKSGKTIMKIKNSR